MKRAKMRENLFHFLYQVQIQKNTPLIEQKRSFLAYLEEDFSEEDLNYFSKLVDYYEVQLVTIDEDIKKYLRGWTIDRISKIDLALLRLACLELRNQKETPPKVIASEIVILTKKYSDERSKQYINGILGEMLKEVIDEEKPNI